MDINILHNNPKEYIMNIPKKAIFIIVAVILLIALGVAGYFYWTSWEKSQTGNTPDTTGSTAEDITKDALKGVLPSLDTNPLKDAPDVNPADKANPFKDIKINPF